jgi:hypothetical protein
MSANNRLFCVECGRVDDDDGRGWKAYQGAEGDDEPELFVFSPECAEREFGYGEATPG